MQLRDRAPWPNGWFRLDVFRHGELIERVDEPNLVVSGAGAILAALIGGQTTPLTQIGFGTSNAAAAAGNTTLTAPFLKGFDTVTYPVPGTASFAFTLGSTEANGTSIGEFGLLTAAGLLFARKARIAPNIPKDNTISLAGTWLINWT